MKVKADKSWCLFGGPQNLSYRCFDLLRNRLNSKLSEYLYSKVDSQGQKNIYILEVGSGPAFASSLLAKKEGVRLSIALDYDIEVLRLAKKRDKELLVVNGNIYHLPFKDGSFSLVWNSSTMEHLEDIEAGLLEMQRVAASDGFIFVGVPYKYGPLFPFLFLQNRKVGIWIGRLFSRGNMIYLLKRHKLKIVEFKYYFFNFFLGVVVQKQEEF
ncbi:class I SAM-dependent methyltransferase [bacterium]|nr:class I SAM-dependent methyltransferase [bacterium]